VDERRPIGIVLLGIISLLGGVALLFVGIVLVGVVAFGPEPTGNGTFVAGLLVGAVGLLYMAVAAGAWFGLPWALTIGVVTAALGLVAGVFTLLATGSVAHGLATLVFPAFLLWYLNRADVQAAFDDDR
jgi:hypothetical protein